MTYSFSLKSFALRSFLLGLTLLVPNLLSAEKKADYVPEPKPIQTKVELTAFYYPGTEQMAEWDMVEQTRPEIKPLLGWYDEGNPEVIDWQIKWAVEHGISTFLVDWYWNQGVQRLDHWVKGFYQARYRKYLKWCMMWANHNEPGAHSTADQIAVTKFWIENYFKTPEYYTIDGKPVVIIWQFSNLDADFIAEAAKNGETLQPGEGAKRALDLTQKLVKEAGLPGVCFIQMNPNAKTFELAQKAGFSSQMDYNFFWQAYALYPEDRGPNDTNQNYSYDLVIKTVQKYWKETWNSDFPHWPILPCGWNDLPRSFQKARVMRDRTPEKFRQVCESCLKFCEENQISRVVISPINEWQEGTYIEPNQEYGFAMFDALRDVFGIQPAEGWPENVTPDQLGLGPYDYPAMERTTRREWTFDLDPEGWYRQPYGTGMIRVFDGALRIVRTNPDRAAIRIRTSEFDAKEFKTFTIRMKIQPSADSRYAPKGTEQLKLYWGTTDHPIFDRNLVISERNTQLQPIIPDGQWHEYVLPLSENPNWTGRVNELWFDPIDLHHAQVDVDWIRFR